MESELFKSVRDTTVPVDRGQCQPIDLIGKLTLISDCWQPRVVAEMNEYQFKVVKVEGEFQWHRHSETDETFIVLEGELNIDVRSGPSGEETITLHAGQMAVVPRGVEHKPWANAEAKVLLIEPRGILNTGGNSPNERTVENDQWI